MVGIVVMFIYLGNPHDLLFLPEWKKATLSHHILRKCLQAFLVYCRRFFSKKGWATSIGSSIGAPPLDPSCHCHHCPFLT